MKKIVILGSTGVIGRQALEIIRAYPKELKVIGLSAYKNIELLKKQIKEFKPQQTACGNEDLTRIATLKEADLVLISVVGTAGLRPTLAAIRAKKNVALATKEVLVLAGGLVMNEVKKNKVQLIPVDSEHSAIFQCLHSGINKEIKRIILTMGKGRFAFMSHQELEKVSLKTIYEKPTWRMGQKISVDSATCLNKSFEVIEAKWLFDLSEKQISIVVHPEYLCHSMVEFQDGSIIAEIGTADMRRYIQYALFYPERKKAKITDSVDLINKKISFEPPPINKFPGLNLGHKAVVSGGTMPAVLHGADDSAVDAFIRGEIKFTNIPSIIKQTMENHRVKKNPCLNEIFKAEEWARGYSKKIIIEKKYEK